MSLGVFGTYGVDVQAIAWRSDRPRLHDRVGMLGVINAALTGVVAACLAILALGEGIQAVAIGVGAFLVVLVISVGVSARVIAATVAGLNPRFPSPGG